MNRIKELRKNKKISQDELANILNVSRQAISHYERGDREPKLATWEKLADIFNIENVAYVQGLSHFKNAQESRDAWHSLRSSANKNHSSYLDKYNDGINKQKDFYNNLFGQVEKSYLDNQTPIKNLNDKQKKALAYLFDNIINQAEQLAQLPSDRADLFISRSIDDSKEFQKAFHGDNEDDAYDYVNDR